MAIFIVITHGRAKIREDDREAITHVSYHENKQEDKHIGEGYKKNLREREKAKINLSPSRIEL